MVNFRKTVRKICFCCGKRKYETKSPEEDNKDFGGGIENVAYEKENTMEAAKSRTIPEQKLSNVIQTHDFLEHYKDMISYDDISRENEELKNCFRSDVVSRVAQLPGNRGKNRYMNILANEATRVKLAGSYINANFIEIKNSQTKDYIATQGPLPGTKADFWNMIWAEKSLVIVMLVQLVENGRIKCDQYWPFDEKKETVSETLEVEKTEENILPLWTERTFYLSNGTDTRKVRHYQFTSWSGATSDTLPNISDLVSFIKHVRSDLPLEDIGPMVVHCSDGSAKTGLFIALDQVLRDLTEESFVNILGMVYQMKKCRQSLISSESQYKLIYDSVRDSLLGKFDETDAISDGIKTSLSVENLNEEELHKPYVNPALMDDSSSDSSGSLTDSDEELPTIIPNTMKATDITINDNSSSSGSEPFND